MTIKELRAKQKEALENGELLIEDGLRDEIIDEYEKLVENIKSLVDLDCVPCCATVKQIENLLNDC